MTIIYRPYIVPKDLTNTPTGLAGVEGSPRETVIELSWNSITDKNGAYPAGYKLYRDNVLIQTLDHTTLAYIDTGLVEATGYNYQIGTSDRFGYISTLSSNVRVITYDATAPSVPTNLTVVAGTDPDTELDISWTASTDNSGRVWSYLIYRDDVLVQTVSGSPIATSWSDTGLDEQTVYDYQVLAKDETGNESAKTAITSGGTTDSAWVAEAIGMDAAEVSMTHNLGSGVSANKFLLYSVWTRNDYQGNQQQIVYQQLSDGSIELNTTDNVSIKFKLRTTSFVTILAFEVTDSTSPSIPATPKEAWTHYLLSIDMDSQVNSRLFINDEEYAISWDTFDTGTNIPWDVFTSVKYLFPANYPLFRVEYDNAELYLTNEYLDLSVEANRRKFINADGTPPPLGVDGRLPTFTQPLLYMSGDATVWNAGTNKGSAANLTTTGTFTDSTYEPVLAADHVPLYQPNAVDLNGNMYKSAAPALGSPVSGGWTLSMWVYGGLGFTSTYRPLVSFSETTNFVSTRFQIGQKDGDFVFYMRNLAGTVVTDIETTGNDANMAPSQWHHLYMRGTSTGVIELKIDGANPSGWLNRGGTADNVDLTRSDWYIMANGNSGSLANDVAEFWFDTGTGAAIGSFYKSESGGHPIDLGSDGSNPTGESPLIFYAGDASVWNTGTNLGTGGDFTASGTVTNSTNEPVEN